MKDMQRIEILFQGVNGRFDLLETRFEGLESRFDVLESRFDVLEADIKPMLARIPFIERKLDAIKVVVGGHSSKLIKYDARISKLEQRS